ncbi:MAG: transglutaminase-like domain-containing protein, partial [Brooklawnia sp.]
ELGAAAVRELDYTVESRPSAPTADELAAAIAGTPPEGAVASQSADAPTQIAELASQITAAASTDGERAVLLQNWLRDPERFDYDLNAPEGTGYDSLVSFLFTERRGYCVHFAASMALMSRQVGIPARVAVGFTTGAPQADGSFVVTSHNMHAWPELYFAGLGWVRFEPTASVGAKPDWTELPEPAEQSAPSPTPTPTTEPSPVPQPDQETADDTESDEQSGLTAIDWRWPAGVVGALLLLVGPGLARALLRRHRLAATTPETRVDGAWRELRASAIDLGLDWPDLTPRQLAGASWPGLNTAGRQGLRRIALLVERRDYSPGLPGDVSVADDVRLVTEQWRASRNRWRQLWTRVVPRSLLMDVRWPWAE